MRPVPAAIAAALAALIAAAPEAAPAGSVTPLPARVSFPSADGRTTLEGYLYMPRAGGAARAPAVVMMHGRSGVYSTAAKGRFGAATLSKRHKMWGAFWSAQGYVALLVDSFGPRGYPQGFPRFSYKSRPAALNEVTVRPLDAYGALAYLRGRADVLPDRIGLQGWSNGGSAALATMAVTAPGIANHTPQAGFRAALAFYPGCRLKGQFDRDGYRPYAPVQVLHGTADDEVSYRHCEALVQRSRTQGGAIELRLYPGATHSFDTPTRKRQRVEANAAAMRDALMRARRFFADQLGNARSAR